MDKFDGKIDYDRNTEEEVPLIVVDGKEYTWKEFGEMLMTYEGFKFKLEIYE